MRFKLLLIMGTTRLEPESTHQTFRAANLGKNVFLREEKGNSL